MKEENPFYIPSYSDFPKISIYKDQLLEILNEYLQPFYNEDKPVTSTMINNYVKFQIIDAPINKRYFRDQVVYLYLVGLLKKVYSLEEIKELIKFQQSRLDVEQAYNYCSEELRKIFYVTFVTRDFYADKSRKISEERELLKSVIISVVNKIYVEKKQKELL